MIEFKPVTANIGAEVTGIDMSKPLSDEDIATIRQGLLDYLVLFFRDQHITDEQHLEFGLRFGPLSIPPIRSKDNKTAEVTILNQTSPKGEGGDEWHQDNTFMPNPPLGSILRAVKLPDVGGDTCFSNAYMAYETLSPPIQRLCDELVAVHDITNGVQKAKSKGHPLDLEQMQSDWPPVEHPVVRVHEETGRKALFINRSSTTHFKGLNKRENEALLPMLLDHVRSPEFQCRLTWQVGTVAFWDNRSLFHYAVADYTQRREMHRVTVDFDKSVVPA